MAYTESEMNPQAEITERVRRSPSTAKLDEAMAKAVLEFESAEKGTENPYFKSKYADLATLIKATREHMAKHGVTLRMYPLEQNGRAGVTSRLCCAGEWEESDYTLPVSKQDAQGVGSALTYARRYAYQSIVNIAGELDDDGNAAVGHEKPKMSARDAKGAIGLVADAMKRGGKTEKQVETYILNAFEIPSIAGLTKAEPEVIDQIIRWCENKSMDLGTDLKASVKQVLTPQVLFKAASRHAIPEGTLREYIKIRFRADSTKDLSPAELQETLEWIQQTRPVGVTT